MPLHIVINRTDIGEAGLLSLLGIFAACGADFDTRDEAGHTALYLVCARHSQAVIRYLLSLGATDCDEAEKVLDGKAVVAGLALAVSPHCSAGICAARPPIDLDPSATRGEGGLYAFSARVVDAGPLAPSLPLTHTESDCFISETDDESDGEEAAAPGEPPLPPQAPRRHALTVLMARPDIADTAMIGLIDALLQSPAAPKCAVECKDSGDGSSPPLPLRSCGAVHSGGGGSSLNAASEGGHTPLSVACSFQSVAVVRYLLKRGADAHGGAILECSCECEETAEQRNNGAEVSGTPSAKGPLLRFRLPVVASLLRNSIPSEDEQYALVALLADAGGADLGALSPAALSTACRSRSNDFKKRLALEFGVRFVRWALQ